MIYTNFFYASIASFYVVVSTLKSIIIGVFFFFQYLSTTVVLSPPYVRFNKHTDLFRYTTYVFSIIIIALYKVLQNPLAVINYHLKNKVLSSISPFTSG